MADWGERHRGERRLPVEETVTQRKRRRKVRRPEGSCLGRTKKGRQLVGSCRSSYHSWQAELRREQQLEVEVEGGTLLSVAAQAGMS